MWSVPTFAGFFVTLTCRAHSLCSVSVLGEWHPNAMFCEKSRFQTLSVFLFLFLLCKFEDSIRGIAMGEAAGDRVLSRLHSVRERIGDSLSAHPNELVAVFTRSAHIFQVTICKLTFILLLVLFERMQLFKISFIIYIVRSSMM